MNSWTPDKVVAAPDQVLAFAEYVQQVLGTPWPTLQDQKILRQKTSEFFARYPHTDMHTLCRIVRWAKGERRRYDRVWKVVDDHRWAWKKGAIPELQPRRTDENLEAHIAAALETETDPAWRNRLLATAGVTFRRAAYEEWLAAQGEA